MWVGGIGLGRWVSRLGNTTDGLKPYKPLTSIPPNANPRFGGAIEIPLYAYRGSGLVGRTRILFTLENSWSSIAVVGLYLPEPDNPQHLVPPLIVVNSTRPYWWWINESTYDFVVAPG